MRILPLFILPHTADGACTNAEGLSEEFNVTNANTNHGKTGIFLVEGTDAQVGCDASNASSYPTSWDLKMTTGTPPLWDHAHIDNYESPNHMTFAVDKNDANAVATASTTKKHWHLHGEQLKADNTIKDICYCGKRGTATVISSRSNWKKGTTNISTSTGDTAWVETTGNATTSNVADGSKICLCNADGTVNATAIAWVTDSEGGFLTHGEVGDATASKTCHNLLWEFSDTNVPLAAKCTNAQICDQFGGTKVCVDKTEQLFNTKTAYTKADTTKKYCIRRVRAGPDDTSFTPSTYAATDQRGYRPRAADDLSDPACTADYYCNPYGPAADRCLDKEKVLGDDTVASAVRAEGTATEKCLGVGTAGSAACTTTQHCNPHADTTANLCIDTAKAFKHAEAGDPDATKDYCIADNAVQAIPCTDKEVCNYGAATTDDVCLAKAELVGKPDIAKGADNWGVIKLKSLRVQPALAEELCMARAFDAGTFSLKTAGAKSFSKQCAIATDDTAQICNPNATSLADVCVLKNTVVVNHGDQVDATKVACIGDTHYKLVLAADMICNMNGNSVANLEIALADTLAGKLDDNKNVIKEGFNKPGEKISGSDDFKWCFDKTQAAQCTDKQTCNPAGTYNDVDKWVTGTDAKATCVETEKLIDHGAQGDDKKVYCLGLDGASKYTKDKDATTPVDQCSRKDGTLYKADEELAAGAIVDTTTAEGVVRCFAEASSLFYDASCKDNYVCNPTGSEAADDCGSAPDKPCSLSNICVFKDARLAVGEKFDDTKATVNICLGDTPTVCDIDNPYCQTTGECDKTAVSGGGAGGEGEVDPASGSATASLVGLSVAAILSA